MAALDLRDGVPLGVEEGRHRLEQHRIVVDEHQRRPAAIADDGDPLRRRSHPAHDRGRDARQLVDRRKWNREAAAADHRIELGRGPRLR